MGLSDFVAACGRVLKLLKKPDLGELWQSVKICALGIGIIGVIGFIIRFMSSLFQGFTP